MKSILNYIQRRKNKLPKYHYRIWYNSHVYNRKNYPIVFDGEGNYISCQTGVKLVMGKTDKGENVYYEVINYKKRSGDFLYDSDGIECTMKFSHIN